MQIPDINLNAIPVPATRQLVGQLLNLIGALAEREHGPACGGAADA